MSINLQIKQRLFEECVKYVQLKIEAAQKGMNDAQSAANNETKSSVGDKYETGRAMMHLEKNKFALQLSEALQLKQQLNQIQQDKTSTQVEQGSLIKTNKGIFLIAISIGKVQLDGQSYFVISLASPVGKALYKTKKGEIVSFRKTKYQILDIV